jgi:polysaccharide pyruvyl transferase CsaB
VKEGREQLTINNQQLTIKSDRSMKAILCGYYGKGNGGDEALLVSLLQMLPKNIEPIVLSGNPTETKKLYNVASYPRASTFPLLQLFQQADFFIWGGGSLMQDATSLASPFYYAGLMALAQQQGLKTIAWAQGIGPLNRAITQWMTRNVLQGCAAISVRDRASAQLLESWQISPIIAPDPVWALESVAVEPDLINTNLPLIAVNLRSHPLLTPQRLQLLTEALQAFQQETNTYILLVPFQQEQDYAIAENIQQTLGKYSQNSQIVTFADPRKLKGLFKNVTMTIGMRLHSLIMAASESSRCFALSYDPKVSQLMQECQIPGWELANLPTNAEKIAQTWIATYQAPNSLATNNLKILKESALIHQEVLFNILQN